MAVRIVHTSDWHLGRSLHGEPLLEDQRWVLERLIDLLREERPDALLVAGDLYDRAVPPPDAVALLDDFITRVRLDLGLRVVAIAGNHDSAERLAFGSRLLQAQGIHIRTEYAQAGEPVRVEGRNGAALVYAVPYVDPEAVRGISHDDSVRGHSAATERVVSAARADRARRDEPAILVAHAFVQGAIETSESERPLAVGGAGSVPASLFDGFDYVALGHLHAPQPILADGAPHRMRYSGSLLKYSFGEASHAKGVLVVEVERAAARVRAVALGCRRDVVRLRGSLDELLTRPELEAHRGNLVQANLTDTGYIVDAIGRLRRRFAHVLEVQRPEIALRTSHATFARRVAGAGGDDLRLFESFYQTVQGASPGPEQRALFAEALRGVERRERAA